MELQVGIKGEAAYPVTEEKTAARWGSGTLFVFATPCLVALMENAACNALEQVLPEGVTTVGTRIDVHHNAATPMGMTVRAEAVLTQIDRKALYFTVTAYDEKGEIGTAEHTRFMVETDRFMQKVQEKSL
ncbi:MAG: thioesterase family protein [Eubacteriales bacterium]|nr:thioesterase family protein [Eubacteriales bacterium]